MQVLERAKTFFALMTKNDMEIINEENVDKIVAKIKSQETRDISKMEKELGKVNIPLEEKAAKKVKVDERKAMEEAAKKAQTKQKGEAQRGE